MDCCNVVFCKLSIENCQIGRIQVPLPGWPKGPACREGLEDQFYFKILYDRKAFPEKELGMEWRANNRIGALNSLTTMRKICFRSDRSSSSVFDDRIIKYSSLLRSFAQAETFKNIVKCRAGWSSINFTTHARLVHANDETVKLRQQEILTSSGISSPEAATPLNCLFQVQKAHMDIEHNNSCNYIELRKLTVFAAKLKSRFQHWQMQPIKMMESFYSILTGVDKQTVDGFRCLTLPWTESPSGWFNVWKSAVQCRILYSHSLGNINSWSSVN